MTLKNSLFLILFFLVSCDFTSGLHKDVLKAQDLINEQRFVEAVGLYEYVLTKKPTPKIKLKIHFQLGQLYSLYLNDKKKALVHLNKILKETNDLLWQVKVIEKIAQINFDNLRNYAEAEKKYKQLSEFVPKLKKQDLYKFRYASSLVQQGKYKNAIDHFKNLTKSKNSTYGVQSYYQLGLINYYKKHWITATRYWFEYLKRERRKDKIVQAKFMIANAYEMAEKLKESYNIYYSILGEYPNSDVIKNRLNSLYERRVARKR